MVLDYNHEKIIWQPSPPPSMRTFYEAFLHWRAEANMDNNLADRLLTMFEEVGLVNLVTTPQHETTQRDDPGFDVGIALWSNVIATRGRQLVSEGVLTEYQRATAEAEYLQWASESAVSQTLYLLAVEGTRVQ